MALITQAKRIHSLQVWKQAFDRYDIELSDAGKPFQSRWSESPAELSDDLVFSAEAFWAISNSLTEKSIPVDPPPVVVPA